MTAAPEAVAIMVSESVGGVDVGIGVGVGVGGGGGFGIGFGVGVGLPLELAAVHVLISGEPDRRILPAGNFSSLAR